MSFFAELKRRNVIRVAVAYFVAAWVLAQIAAVGADAFGAPDWVMKMLITLLAIGLVPTLFFSWIYELTPEGLKKESDVQRDDSVTTHTARKLDIAVIVLLVAAIGLFAIDSFLLNRGSEPAPTEVMVGAEVAEAVTPVETALALGVAVLPFTNLSPDPDNAFFAAGVHEDVLTYLSRVADLRVISRTSVVRYAVSDLSLPEIGRELGVSHVLEGSVRRAGGRVLVTVQLIDSATDDHVWADKYDRKLENVFAIQSEIAQAVVAQVEAELTPQEAADLAELPTTSIEAYDEYLRGLERRRKVVIAGDFDRISNHFLRATELDPDFRAAWLMMLEISSGAVWFTRDLDGLHMRRVRSALARIQVLAPDSPENDLAIGIYHYYVDRDLKAALAALERATIARPNDTQALLFLSRVTRRFKQHWDTAVTSNRRVVLLDPANPRSRRQLISHLYDIADYDAAIDAAAEAIERFPKEVWFRVRHAELVARQTGDVTLCRRLIDDFPPKDLLQNGFRWVSLRRGVFADNSQAIAWIEAADPAYHSYATAGPYVNYVVGIHLLVGGDAEGARLRFQAANTRYSARVDGMNERKLLARTEFLNLFAALAGEQEAALEHRDLILALAAATDEVFNKNNARFLAALTHLRQFKKLKGLSKRVEG